MSRVLNILFGLAFFVSACDRPAEPSLCLAQDLGRYRLLVDPDAQVQGSNCRLTYVDPKGRKAMVRVKKEQRPWAWEGRAPHSFEKHVVLYRPEGEGIRVDWQGKEVIVSLWLEGLVLPEGPVLRAYLFTHGSVFPPEWIALTQFEKTEQVAAAAGKSRPQQARRHLAAARKHQQQGNHNMAIQEYHVAVAADAACFACFFEMSKLYHKLRQWDLAIRAARRAQALRPKSAGPIAWLGDLFYRVRNHEQALGYYQKALRMGLSGDEKKGVQRRLEVLRAQRAVAK